MGKLLHRSSAILAGLLAGGGSVGVVEWISSRMHPMPEGIRMDDMDAMKAWVGTLPASAFLMLAIAWGIGCFVGTLVARRLAPGREALPGLVVWGMLIAATVFNLVSLPHPLWLWPTGVGACLVCGLLGLVLGAPRTYVVATSREIDAPIDRVFATLANVQEFKKAVSGITKVEFLTDSHYGVGTRFRETRVMNGREAVTELEVTELVENSHVRIISDAGGTIWDTVFKVTDNVGNTAMTMRMEARPHNLPAKIVTPLILKMVAGAVERDMDSVKSLCEHNSSTTESS